MLWRWFCYGRNETEFAAITIQLWSAGIGIWGVMPFNSIAFLFNIGIPLLHIQLQKMFLFFWVQRQRAWLLGLSSLKTAIYVRGSLLLTGLKNHVHGLICTQMVTGSQIPSLHDMLSDAQGTVWVILLQLWSFWMEIILLNIYCDYIQQWWAHLKELECKPLSWVAAIMYCVCQQIIDNDISSVTTLPSRLWIELSSYVTVFFSTIQVIILLHLDSKCGLLGVG